MNGHADALSRLPQESSQLMFVTDMFTKREYHDSPDSGGHDGIRKPYLKISERFFLPGLRKDVTEYVRSCEVCQSRKATFKSRPDRVCLKPNTDSPMRTAHFAALSKRGGPGTGTFVVAIDGNTRWAAARAGGRMRKLP